MRRLYTVEVNYHDDRAQWHWRICDYRGDTIHHGFVNDDAPDDTAALRAHPQISAALILLMAMGTA